MKIQTKLFVYNSYNFIYKSTNLTVHAYMLNVKKLHTYLTTLNALT